MTELGYRDFLVLEKEDNIGTDATTKAAGGFRHQFCIEVSIRLSLESVKGF